MRFFYSIVCNFAILASALRFSKYSEPLPPTPIPPAEQLYHRYGKYPRLDAYNPQGKLTWYPIGFHHNFNQVPQRIIVRSIPYVVWRDADTNQYYGMRDCCSHQGASFMRGNTLPGGTVQCPYHGYSFNGTTGELTDIPKFRFIPSATHNVDCFKVVERGGIVYLNTVLVSNEEMRNELNEDAIFIEPEYGLPDQRMVYLEEDFEHYAKFVSVNSLDICHIGFVHSFGNRKQPNPLTKSVVLKMPEDEFHFKIVYKYVAGENSLVNKVYQYNTIHVENEYVLPHSTVARVLFGDMTSTIITHALPISKFKTKLFVKVYRKYWCVDLKKEKNSFLYPFYFLVNWLGDKITQHTMVHTLKEDKAIVDNIDKTSYDRMHGKFSISYDMFSNHYKNQYKKYYEEGPDSI